MKPSGRNDSTPLWTAKEAADYLQVAETTVSQWAKLGKIPHRRAGTLIRFDQNELDEWTREGGAKAAEAATAEKGAA